MLFILLIVLTIAAFVIAAIADDNCWFGIDVFFMFVGVINSILLFISVIGIACEYINIDGRIASYHNEYEMLVYQYENDIYDNDNDLGKRELMVEIQEWNQKMIYAKEAQNDFWIGIFYADIYDQFELIELK